MTNKGILTEECYDKTYPKPKPRTERDIIVDGRWRAHRPDGNWVYGFLVKNPEGLIQGIINERTKILDYNGEAYYAEMAFIEEDTLESYPKDRPPLTVTQEHEIEKENVRKKALEEHEKYLDKVSIPIRLDSISADDIKRIIKEKKKNDDEYFKNLGIIPFYCPDIVLETDALNKHNRNICITLNETKFDIYIKEKGNNNPEFIVTLDNNKVGDKFLSRYSEHIAAIIDSINNT